MAPGRRLEDMGPGAGDRGLWTLGLEAGETPAWDPGLTWQADNHKFFVCVNLGFCCLVKG